MAAELTKADVERIAALAHLELTEEEKDLFTTQLAGILHYAEQVEQVDTTGVPPMAHVGAERTERDDEPRPSIPTTAGSCSRRAAGAVSLRRSPRCRWSRASTSAAAASG